MTTIRSHDQFNTSIYGLDDRYRGIYNGRRVVFMNEADNARRRPRSGGNRGFDEPLPRPGAPRRALHGRPLSDPRGCSATYFPEANVLVPVDSVADESNCPASKSVVITVRSSADQSLADEMIIHPGRTVESATPRHAS